MFLFSALATRERQLAIEEEMKQKLAEANTQVRTGILFLKNVLGKGKLNHFSNLKKVLLFLQK